MNWKIASSATFSRFENAADYITVVLLRRVQQDLERYNIGLTKPERVIVDLDTTMMKPVKI